MIISILLALLLPAQSYVNLSSELTLCIAFIPLELELIELLSSHLGAQPIACPDQLGHLLKIINSHSLPISSIFEPIQLSLPLSLYRSHRNNCIAPQSPSPSQSQLTWLPVTVSSAIAAAIAVA